MPKKPIIRRPYRFPIKGKDGKTKSESEISFVEVARERRAALRRRRWKLEEFAFIPHKVVLEDYGEHGKIPHRVPWTAAENMVRQRARARMKRRGKGNYEW
jgi:hypothetical protein